MRMAEELPDDGKAFALDVSDEYVNVGKPVLKKAGLLSKVCYFVVSQFEKYQFDLPCTMYFCSLINVILPS